MSENNQIDDTSNRPTISDMFSDCTRELVRHTETVKLANIRNLCKFDSGYTGRSFKYVEGLPADIENMVNDMKEIQSDIFDIESKYSKKVYTLICKYEELHKSVIKKRSLILSNDVVGPTAAKVARKELQKADEEKPKICAHGNIDFNMDGRPFWYETFKHVVLLNELIMDHDIVALKYLRHVCVTYSDDTSDDVKFFDIHFVFAENKYFENKELTKRYFYAKTKILTTDKTAYKIIRSSGCKINWKNGMNLTSFEDVCKLTGTNLDKSDFKSFFDIFADFYVQSNSHLTDEEKTVLHLSQDLDFQIGQILESSIVRNPHNQSLTTGLWIKSDDNEDEEEEDEDEVL